MSNVCVYQIYYDEPSRARLDPAFIPWDNTRNERPDWAEYWSFRSVWHHCRAGLRESDYLGIFSPRFTEKTGLTGELVTRRVIESQADVISFSPYLTHIAVYANVFEQGERYHPGLIDALSKAMQVLDEPLEWNEIIGTFRNTIFSNYFVARVKVWDDLMKWTERLFEICERDDTELARQLNDGVRYVRGPATMKVFVFERLISLLLWKRSYKAHLGMDFQEWRKIKCVTDGQYSALLSLDALKSQFLETGRSEYLEQFFSARTSLFSANLNMS